MVDTGGVGSRGGPGEGEVPFEKIRVEGGGVEGWVGVGSEFVGFFEDAFDGGRFGVEGREGHGVLFVGGRATEGVR